MLCSDGCTRSKRRIGAPASTRRRSSTLASAPGANQVTVTFDQPAVFVDLRLTEYGGLKTVSPFDVGTQSLH